MIVIKSLLVLVVVCVAFFPSSSFKLSCIPTSVLSHKSSLKSYERDSFGGSSSRQKVWGGSSGSSSGSSSNRRSSAPPVSRFRSAGAGSRFGKPQQDPAAKLRFKKTIKIDPESKTPITDMNLSAKTMDVLRSKGFEYMTPVQSQSYDLVHSGEDLVARSRTGTGKTFAFGLPLIEKIVSSGILEKARDGAGMPMILILEPTRELALQVAQELGSVCAAHRMRVQAIFGGASFSLQERAIRNGVHILVATPGRMLDHISRGTVDLSSIRHVVLDEGDTMLEMGFQKAVESIILNVKSPGEKSRKAAANALVDEYGDGSSDTSEGSSRGWTSSRKRESQESHDDDDAEEDLDSPSVAKAALKGKNSKGGSAAVQMLLFSATMPGWICQLTDKHMNDPVFLDAVQEGETRLADTITHYAVRLPNLTQRLEAVTSYVEDLILTKGAGGQTIVFTNTKEEADNLVGSNCFGQLKSQVLHGDIGQNSRQATIRQFKEGSVDVLVATDVAARGLDIAGVDLVVHTAPPNDADTYVHRSGRTGRAGRSGNSIVLYSSAEERKLSVFENTLKFHFTRTGPPSAQEIVAASAIYAAKKVRLVKPEVVQYFKAHARTMLNDFALRDAAIEADGEDDLADLPARVISDNEKLRASHLAENYSAADVEELVARCLAAISNRNSITSRSMLTGQPGFTTVQVEAVFRNGSTPVSVRDWQSLVAGVLARSLDLQDVRLGKVALGRVAVPGGGSYSRDKQVVALVDLDDEVAAQVLERLSPDTHTSPDQQEQEYALPPGIKIAACAHLPELVVERSAERDGAGRGRTEYRGGSGRSGGSGGGYGDAGRARFGSSSRSGGAGSGSSGRAWGGGGGASTSSSRGSGTSGGKSWQQR